MSEEMKQIVAPPPRSGEDPLTPEAAKVLVTWLDADGWCSCCRREDIAVAHYGNVDRSISFALCGGCIKRMAETLGCSLHEERRSPHDPNEEKKR